MTDPDVALSVVIITYRRPEPLRDCLHSLMAGRRLPDQVLVVDQSPDDASRLVCQQWPSVVWVDNRANAGRMTSSRNVGLGLARGEVVAFIDDDVTVSESWAESVIGAFRADPHLGGLTGPTINPLPAEACGPIGTISRSGRVVGHFDCTAVNEPVAVEHLIGANMSFRRDALTRLNGFFEGFPGTAMAEDTDVSLRVRELGYRLAFDPSVLVHHHGAPHVHGRRFDLRYRYFASRNYTAMLLRHRWFLGPRASRLFVSEVRSEASSERRIASRMARLAAHCLGSAAGVIDAARLRRSVGEL